MDQSQVSIVAQFKTGTDAQKTAKKNGSPRVLSPLGLLLLGACGSSGGSGVDGEALRDFLRDGSIVKGPLENALAFIDYDGDRVRDADEPFVRTDADGKYSLTGRAGNEDAAIVALTDDSTVDTSSGTVLSGVVLSAPATAKVVSMASTLMVEGGLTEQEVQEALGLDGDVDLLTFNPYDLGEDATDEEKALAAKVEVTSQSVGVVLTAMTAAAKGAGLNAEEAFKASLKAVAEVVVETAQSKGTVNLADKDGALAQVSQKVKASVEAKASSDAGVSVASFEALDATVRQAVSNVNTEIAKITDISAANTSEAASTFSVAQVLASQIETAVAAEKAEAGSGTTQVTFSDANAVLEAKANQAPTDIDLVVNGAALGEGIALSVVEGTTNLTLGAISVTDADNGDAGFVYTLAGEDADKFTIVDGKLALKNSPDFEAQSSYSVAISAKDAGGKAYSETFTINVTDVEEAVLAANFRINTAGESDGSLVDNLVGPGGTLSKVSQIDLVSDSGVVTFSALSLDEPNIQESLTDGLGKYVGPVINISAGAPAASSNHTIKIVVLEGENATRTVASERMVEISFDVSIELSGGEVSLSNANSVSLSYSAKGESSAGTQLNNLPLTHETFGYDADTGALQIRLLDTIDALAQLARANPTDLILNEATSKFSGLIKSSPNYYFEIQGFPILDENGTQVSKIAGPISILDLNAAPTLTTTTDLSTTEDTATAAIAFAGADIDGDSLSYSFSDPAKGSVADNGNGTFTYTPDANANGQDSFTLSVTDGTETTTKTINVSIAAVNDAPTGSASASLANGDEDTAYTVSIADLTAGFSDVDGDALSVKDLTASSGATVVRNEDTSYTITPAANYNGTVTLTYTVTDGKGGDVADVTRSFTLDAVNDDIRFVDYINRLETAQTVEVVEVSNNSYQMPDLNLNWENIELGLNGDRTFETPRIQFETDSMETTMRNLISHEINVRFIEDLNLPETNPSEREGNEREFIIKFDIEVSNPDDGPVTISNSSNISIKQILSWGSGTVNLTNRAHQTISYSEDDFGNGCLEILLFDAINSFGDTLRSAVPLTETSSYYYEVTGMPLLSDDPVSTSILTGQFTLM